MDRSSLRPLVGISACLKENGRGGWHHTVGEKYLTALIDGSGAYPLSFIPNASATGRAPHPKNIIMLTCDAYGVLPPIARLTPAAPPRAVSGWPVPGGARSLKDAPTARSLKRRCVWRE